MAQQDYGMGPLLILRLRAEYPEEKPRGGTQRRDRTGGWCVPKATRDKPGAQTWQCRIYAGGSQSARVVLKIDSALRLFEVISRSLSQTGPLGLPGTGDGVA